MRTGIFAAVTIALVTQAPAAFASQLSWEAIRQGDTGREVYTLQYLLREAGLTVSIDGIFGTDTDARVRDFQRAKGLTVDGVVGGNTWEALIKTVRQGDNNNAVRAVQDQLRSGYGYASVTVDGIFGSGTDTAVRDFQTKRELGADGIVGLNTWHALVNGSGTVGTGTGGTTATLASQILSNGRITLGTSSDTTGGNPKQNMVDTSNGLPVKRGCATNANCGLTTTLKRSMLEGMLKVANTGTIYITSIAGGSTRPTRTITRGWPLISGSGTAPACRVRTVRTRRHAMRALRRGPTPARRSTRITTPQVGIRTTSTAPGTEGRKEGGGPVDPPPSPYGSGEKSGYGRVCSRSLAGYAISILVQPIPVSQLSPW